MSEGYKKIELEDVKKGQRVRVVERHRSHIATYEGIVVTVTDKRDQFDDPDVWEEIELGEKGDEVVVPIDPYSDTTILLLEDAPKPKVVRTETVTITHYDDGTTTQTSVDEIPMVIKTADQFEAYEDYLKQVVIKDCAGDYWTYRDGRWGWTTMTPSVMGTWNPTTGSDLIRMYFPLTIVENVGD